MIYLMNSAVMPPGNHGLFLYEPSSLNALKAIVSGEKGPFKSFIGYPENAELIQRWTGYRPEICRDTIRFSVGDSAFVMRLPERLKKLIKGLPIGRVSPDGWEFAIVTFFGERKDWWQT